MKVCKRIPVILMLQEKQETLVPINAVSLCCSVHIPPITAVFGRTGPNPSLRARSVQPTSRGTQRVSTASNQQRCGGLECGDGTLGHYNARAGADLIMATQRIRCLLTLQVNPASLRPVKDRVYVTQISTMDRAFTNMNRKCRGVVNYGVPSVT